MLSHEFVQPQYELAFFFVNFQIMFIMQIPSVAPKLLCMYLQEDKLSKLNSRSTEWK
jgi:hypothetical protein